MFRRSGHWFADKNMRHSRSWPKRQRQTQQPDEDRDREGDHDRREREILQWTHVARGVGADEHEHRDRGDESEPLQRRAEQHDRNHRHADRPQIKARHRFALERKRAQRDDHPERGKQRPHEGREHSRPHAMHVAKPILLRENDEAAPDRDEDQPRPEILRRTDAHHQHTASVMPAQAGIQYRPCRPLMHGRAPWSRSYLLDRPLSRAMTARSSGSIRPDVRLLAALEGMVSTPPPAKRSFTSGMWRILTTRR